MSVPLKSARLLIINANVISRLRFHFISLLISQELRADLEEKQEVMHALQETADQLCRENHPAKQTVEVSCSIIQNVVINDRTLTSISLCIKLLLML